jgi:hypothetical protein
MILMYFLRTFRYRFQVVAGLRPTYIVDADSTFKSGTDYSLGEHGVTSRGKQSAFAQSQCPREHSSRDQLERFPCTPTHYCVHDNQRGRSFPLPVRALTNEYTCHTWESVFT